MEIMVNGKACTLKEGATVTDALKALGAVPIYTAVEVDGRLVPVSYTHLTLPTIA